MITLVVLSEWILMPELGFTDLSLAFCSDHASCVFSRACHYWVARKAGVVVDVFSIGFGPEIYGWTAIRNSLAFVGDPLAAMLKCVVMMMREYSIK